MRWGICEGRSWVIVIFAEGKVSQITLIKVLVIVYSVTIFSRVISKEITSTFELSLSLFVLGVVLFRRLLADQGAIPRSALILTAFFLYLAAHFFYSIFYHSFITWKMGFWDMVFCNIYEFKVSYLGYCMFFPFLGLKIHDSWKLENFLVLVLKCFAIYTIGEQIVSLAGFRSTIEWFFQNNGMVTGNLIGLRSLGMYRVWGLIGSTPLLGLVHVFLFFWLLHRRESSYWRFLAFFAIVLSTSKTAWVVFLLLYAVYLANESKRLLVMFVLTVIPLVYSVVLFGTTSENPFVRNFSESSTNFIFIATYRIDPATDIFVEGNSFQEMVDDLCSTSFLFGKGQTFSFTGPLDLPRPLLNFQNLTSDFYIISFVQQFGLIGLGLFTLVFFAIPMRGLWLKGKGEHYYILITFFLACGHYPPQISKLLMLFVGFSLWKVFCGGGHVELESISSSSNRNFIV